MTEIVIHAGQQAMGLVDGPRIVATNLIVCMTGGHASWIGREADGPDDVRKAVREQLRAGVPVGRMRSEGM